jgi:hypothetical protein
VDHVIVLDELESDPAGLDCIPTTSHSREDLGDALDFFRDCAHPSPVYEATTRAWLAVSVGNIANPGFLHARLRNPICCPESDGA